MQDQWAEAVISSVGARLAARIYRPVGPAKGVALIHPATGAPQKIYRPFAIWLTETHQLTVVTYDYRDFGESAALGVSVRASKADKLAWGVHDQSAAVDFAAELATEIDPEIDPRAPVTVIGHSLGGMTTPLHHNAHKISRLIAVASGPAHWTSHPFPYVLFVILFWFVIGPISTLVLGYTPGRRLGLGADLPAGVFWQWRRWCTTRGFYKPDVGGRLPMTDFRNVQGPVKLVAVADDQMIPPYGVAKLAAFYQGAEVSQITLGPDDEARAGGKRRPVGHFGAFLPAHARLWPKIMA